MTAAVLQRRGVPERLPGRSRWDSSGGLRVISHRTALEDVPEMGERFDEREEGVTKVLPTP
ncbi:hypothetical protein [Natrinema ejinorense]|uniref:Uncharacterized protein n=1 Tax=Natrinema ejinorense TaxID=373386 RepID=A0A2A5QWE0_9EURY|nr:hypothetical protein [Natrinema ejinorense]PCR91135.1 hypothetical protein CP557_11725 [Natrinema ejinorense]